MSILCSCVLQTSASESCRLIKAKLQQIIRQLLLADSEQEVRARDLKPIIADPEPACNQTQFIFNIMNLSGKLVKKTWGRASMIGGG